MGLVGKIIMALVAVLLLAAIVLGLSWRSIQRGKILDRMDAAADVPSAIEVGKEFLAYTTEDQNQRVLVSNAISDRRGPPEAQIFLAVEMMSVKDLLGIALRSELDDQHRARAVEETNKLLLAKKVEAGDLGYLSHVVKGWLHQKDREADKINRDLMVAAVVFIGVTGMVIGGSDPADILRDVILDTARPPAVTDAAVDALERVTNSSNVGHALALLSSANADKVIDHGKNPGEPGSLRHRIQQSVTPNVLAELLKLLEHPDQRVRATTIGLLKGPGLRSISEAQKEVVGKQISQHLRAETRSEQPMIFTEALKSAASLGLHGSRASLIALLPQIPADHEDAATLAQALGKDFIAKLEDKNPEAKPRGEEILAALAQALDDPAARTTAARALAQVQHPGYTNLRLGLEQAVKHGTDPDCLTAAKHIVVKLYQRQDLATAWGEDPVRWADGLAQDKPRYERYREIETWHDANKGKIRVSDDQDLLMKNKEFGMNASTELNSWNLVAPIGIEKAQLERMIREVDLLKISLIKAATGV